MSSLGALFVDLAYTPTCLVWSTFVGLFYTPTFLLRCLKGPIMLMGFNSMELGLTILMLVWV